MVEIEKIRAEFAKRLHKACELAGVRERGRAVDIQRELKGRGVHTSTTAIGKWLNGDSIPEPDKLIPLADWLKVRPEWLEYGRGPMQDGAGVLPFMLGAAVFPAIAAVGAAAVAATPAPRTGAEILVESEKDAEFLEKVIAGVPMLARIRRVRAALAAMDKEEAESIAQKVVGCPKYASEILILLDAVLEAAVYQAIDLDEIQAITTLVQKRRNEKVHGKGLLKGKNPTPKQ
ncbi:hypothetical protein D3C76_274240 [compost metagenome]